jgi:hypothetical protein
MPTVERDISIGEVGDVSVGIYRHQPHKRHYNKFLQVFVKYIFKFRVLVARSKV